MTGRYSDRYFRDKARGPDLVDLGEPGGPGGSGWRAPDPGEQDDQDELAPGLGPAGPGWRRNRLGQLALVAALVVGAAGGAYGWERWRDHEDAVAALSAVELSTWTSTLNYPSPERVDLSIRYRNDGAHPITILGAGVPSDRLRTSGAMREVSLEPGETGTQLIKGRLDCGSADPAGSDGSNGSDGSYGSGWSGTGSTTAYDDPPELLVEARTADGAVRSVTVPTTVSSDLGGWLEYACYMDQQADQQFSYAYAQLSSVEAAGDTVLAELQVSSEGGTAPAIRAVEVPPSAFMVAHTLVDDVPTSAGIRAVFTVKDCEQALTAGEPEMTLTISGRMPGGPPGVLITPPSPDLAAELVRLAVRVCA